MFDKYFALSSTGENPFTQREQHALLPPCGSLGFGDDVHGSHHTIDVNKIAKRLLTRMVERQVEKFAQQYIIKCRHRWVRGHY
jgi:hypothetical protein